MEKKKGAVNLIILIGGFVVFVIIFVLIMALPAYALSLLRSTESVFGTNINGGSINCASWDNAPLGYQDIFTRAANSYGIHPALVGAIFLSEHGGSWANGPWASSPKGASGPFQFMPATWASNGVDGDKDGDKDIQDITDASFGAARYLQAILSAHVKTNLSTTSEIDIKLAAGGYNWGPGNISQLREFLNGNGNIPEETRKYMINAWQYFQNLNNQCDVFNIIGVGSLSSIPKSAQGVYKGNLIVYPVPGSCAGETIGTGRGRWHEGVDIPAPTGKPIYAIQGGKVILAGISTTAGNWLQIQNGDFLMVYMHLNSLGVVAGETVKTGDIIGTVGDTGHSNGPHLHFEMWVPGSNRVAPNGLYDPLTIFRDSGIKVCRTAKYQ